MKFFVPCTEDRDDAEGAWFAIRQWLDGIGLFTTCRRIAALVCAIDGVDHVLAVGRHTPDGEMAVVILESDDRELYYVCTYRHGVFEGIPRARPRRAVARDRFRGGGVWGSLKLSVCLAPVPVVRSALA